MTWTIYSKTILIKLYHCKSFHIIYKTNYMLIQKSHFTACLLSDYCMIKTGHHSFLLPNQMVQPFQGQMSENEVHCPGSALLHSFVTTPLFHLGNHDFHSVPSCCSYFYSCPRHLSRCCYENLLTLYGTVSKCQV